MRTITLDFSDCITIEDFLNVFRIGFNYPDFSKKDMDFLYEFLYNFCDNNTYVTSMGIRTLPYELRKYISALDFALIKLNRNNSSIISKHICDTEIALDFRKCKSISDISDILTEKLNLTKSCKGYPHLTLNALKDYKTKNSWISLAYEKEISKEMINYISDISDIFENINKKFQSITCDVYIQQYVDLDFTDCKYIYDIHEVFKKAFDFPGFYGRNMDALWDCIYDYCGKYTHMHLIGLDTLDREFDDTVEDIIGILQRLHDEEESITFDVV